VARISTGEVLREAIAQGTPIGRVAEPLLAQGGYAPDEMMMDIMRARVAAPDCERGYVLDGYPRTLPQAHGLRDLAEGGAAAFVVFQVEVPREELVRRLAARGRVDDTAGMIGKRLAEHQTRTLPVADYLRTRTRLVEVDGSLPVAAVQQEIVHALNGHGRGAQA
jgi:adenylate kinase